MQGNVSRRVSLSFSLFVSTTKLVSSALFAAPHGISLKNTTMDRGKKQLNLARTENNSSTACEDPVSLKGSRTDIGTFLLANNKEKENFAVKVEKRCHSTLNLTMQSGLYNHFSFHVCICLESRVL